MFDIGMPTETVRNRLVKDLCVKYDFVRREKVGESVCGRSIDALSVGNGDKRSLWVAAHHGLEWITTLIVLKFFDEICNGYASNASINGVNVRGRLQNRGLTIIPCLNPDGVEIAISGFNAVPKAELPIKDINDSISKVWQSNANGVDLNHNYDAGWAELHKLERKNNIVCAAHTRYGGRRPESEPETIAITNFCRKNYFENAIAFHSQGEEIYWNYGENTSKESESLAIAFSLLSGYEVSSPEGLAVGGGFKDWFIEEFNRPAFTIEVGKGKNPLPIKDFAGIYEKLRGGLYMFALIG